MCVLCQLQRDARCIIITIIIIIIIIIITM